MIYGFLKMLAGFLNIITLGCKDFDFDGRFLMSVATRQSIAQNKREWKRHEKKQITYGKKLVFDDKSGELIKVDRP